MGTLRDTIMQDRSFQRPGRRPVHVYHNLLSLYKTAKTLLDFAEIVQTKLS